jgi:hypothetical protein
MTRRLRSPLVRYTLQAQAIGQSFATVEVVARSKKEAKRLARDDWHFRFACEHGAVPRVIDEEVVA